MWQVKGAIELCWRIHDSIYTKSDEDIISLIKQSEKWVSNNAKELPDVFHQTWQDVIGLKASLEKCQNCPNDSEAKEEATGAAAHCYKMLAETVSKLKEILENHQME